MKFKKKEVFYTILMALAIFNIPDFLFLFGMSFEIKELTWEMITFPLWIRLLYFVFIAFIIFFIAFVKELFFKEEKNA